MLQQTRVDTVLPYYQRFLSRFPSLEALALASEDEVLAAWSGLGYYRRARMLHQGVREVVARYGGAVPRDPERAPVAAREWAGTRQGRSAASASVSRSPSWTATSRASSARLFGIASALPDRVTQVRLWDLAEQLVVGERPGDFNQAMMELGALVCTVKSPGCDDVPGARPVCGARAGHRARAAPHPPQGAAAAHQPGGGGGHARQPRWHWCAATSRCSEGCTGLPMAPLARAARGMRRAAGCGPTAR
jgi:A/G-specific adenine glycosylase